MVVGSASGQKKKKRLIRKRGKNKRVTVALWVCFHFGPAKETGSEVMAKVGNRWRREKTAGQPPARTFEKSEARETKKEPDYSGTRGEICSKNRGGRGVWVEKRFNRRIIGTKLLTAFHLNRAGIGIKEG